MSVPACRGNFFAGGVSSETYPEPCERGTTREISIEL